MRSLPNALKGQVDGVRIALKICFGLVPLLAGLDKYFNLLADWPHYLSPLAVSLLPVSPEAAMHVIGVVEIIVGILVFSRFTVEGSVIAAIWLVAIALNLILAGFFDIAVRDLVLAVSAYGLACLTAAHEAVSQPVRTTQRASQPATARSAA